MHNPRISLRDYAKAAFAKPGPRLAGPGGQIRPWSWKEWSGGRWVPTSGSPSGREQPSPTTGSSGATLPPLGVSKDSAAAERLTLVTWNIDGWGASPAARMNGILGRLQALSPTPDVIFFQEVNGHTLDTLLAAQWVQEGWYSSSDGHEEWRDASVLAGAITLVTLVSKRLGDGLGDVWRVELPSRFERDALCADISLSALKVSSEGGRASPQPTTVRLMNVHLDSLALDPSFRPAQVSLLASHISGSPDGPLQAEQDDQTRKTGGCGIIAGDWNPVQPFDDHLCPDNGLIDSWTSLYDTKHDPGYTWNWDGSSPEPYPPNRLDKVGVRGLKPVTMEVLVPGKLDDGVLWSDHAGLHCVLEIDPAARAAL